MRSKAAVFRRCPVFRECDPSTVRTLALVSRVRTVARRAPLWSGPPAPLLVQSGVLREAGLLGERPVNFGFHGRGAILGTETLMDRVPQSQVEAYEDCVVLDVPLRELQRCLEKDHQLWLGLARWELDRRHTHARQLLMVAHGTAPRRVATALLELAKAFGVRDSRGTIVNLRLTHRELAAVIGSTRETVSVTVTDLRSRGLVEVDGKHFVLLDKRALTRIATGDKP